MRWLVVVAAVHVGVVWRVVWAWCGGWAGRRSEELQGAGELVDVLHEARTDGEHRLATAGNLRRGHA